MPAMWIPKRLVEVGLVNTAAADPASFVSHCEIEYESRVLAAAAESKSHDCKIVMLTGPSASGKTTSAHKLKDALIASGTPSVVVSLDDFYKNIEDYPHLPDGSVDYENVHALDVPEIHRCLLELIEKGGAEFPLFDFETEHRKEQRQRIELAGGIMVVEGIHALNPVLTDALPAGSVYKIYAGLREEYSRGGQRFLPTRDIRLARRIVRDRTFRDHTPEKTIGMWGNVCDGEDTYIKNFKFYADLLLDTSFSYEICLLADYIVDMKGSLDAAQGGMVLDDLAERLSACVRLEETFVPPNSMLREFIG